MNKRDVLKPIEKGESDTLEFKSSLADINKIVEDISGFSNSRSGKILIGISNSGKVLGIEIGKDTVERLANKIVSNTEPKVYPNISVKEIDAKKIIVIEIPKSSETVLAFGRPFKRVGKSTVKMSKEEYEKLIIEKKKVYFDSQVCEKATLDDIDWIFVKGFFIPKYETITGIKVVGKPEKLLEALSCIKKRKPTNSGILLFGKNPQKFFTNAYIALARYKGKEVGIERLDYKEFDGNLFQQVDNCDKYIKERVAVMSRLLPYQVERQDIPEYGLFSIRELITNAVVHRDYSEQRTKVIIKMFDGRIDFYNPGGLPREITPQNITEKQFSRNPTIAKVFAKVKYIEELGEGWDKIIKEHKDHPLKPNPPKIKADEYTVLVTLFSTKERFEEKKVLELSGRQKKIMKYLEMNKRITTGTCAKLLNVSNDTALRELSKLKSLGIILRRGIGRGIYYVIK